MKNGNLEEFFKIIVHKFLGNYSILIVEDETEAKEFMLNFLTKSEIKSDKIHFANNEEEALLKVKSEPLALIIVDVKMDNFNGFNFIRNIKLNKKLKNIPTIIIGNCIDKDIISKAFNLHVENILVKPLSPHQFIEKVGHSLSV